MTSRFCFLTAILICFVLNTSAMAQSDQVIAFWSWEEDYDFSATDPTKQDFFGDVDNTVSGNAVNQIFLGDATSLDDNGGGGFVSYTSSTSGLTYGPTRTAKWDDLKGGGDDFDINGVSTFMVDKRDGLGPQADDFGNDALMYITFDGTGFQDFRFRFDIESTPTSLASSFDVFYRTGGTGTWFRDPSQNNISLDYMDYTPVDPDNMFADSGFISLSSMLHNQSQIEIIISDFAEFGNDEMEIDNLEFIGRAVPEPASTILLACCGLGFIRRRR